MRNPRISSGGEFQHKEARAFLAGLSGPWAPDSLGSNPDPSLTSYENLDDPVICFFIYKGKDNDTTASWGVLQRDNP